MVYQTLSTIAAAAAVRLTCRRRSRSACVLATNFGGVRECCAAASALTHSFSRGSEPLVCASVAESSEEAFWGFIQVHSMY